MSRFPEDWDPIKDGGYLTGRPMKDGRWWCLMELAPIDGRRVRIVIAEDYATAGEHWCYSDAVLGMVNYAIGPDFPPSGWSRHMLPDGTMEYPNETTHRQDRPPDQADQGHRVDHQVRPRRQEC